MTPPVPRDQALLYCRALANLVIADEVLESSELRRLDATLARFGLSWDDRDVRAAIDGELAAPTDIAELARGIDTAGLRIHLLRDLIDAVRERGRLDAAERRRIHDVATLFGLSAEVPDDLLDWFADPDAPADLRRRCARLLLRVVAADHMVTEEERAVVAAAARAWGLDPADAQLEAILWEELGTPSRIEDLVAAVPGHELRRTVLRKMVEIAGADGRVVSGESDLVFEAARLMGFDDDLADELISWSREALLRVHTP